MANENQLLEMFAGIQTEVNGVSASACTRKLPA
jgi:hypothetical protein